MKKLISMLLVLAMVLALAPVVFASEESPEASAEQETVTAPSTEPEPEPAAGPESEPEPELEPESEPKPEQAADAEPARAVLPEAAAALPGPDELFAGYVSSLFDAPGGFLVPVTDGRPFVRDGLSERDARIYDALAPYFEEIAAGERTSTRIELSLPQLGVEKTVWTAKELGLSSVVRNGELTDDARTAVHDELLAILADVVYAYMVDSPYTMYWFDKEHVFYLGVDVSAGQVDGEWVAVLGDEVTVAFGVAPGYAVGILELDPDGVLRAKAAAENAKEIVARCAGLGDYEKLKAYADEICALTEYADYDSGRYDDIYQLVYVFDGDPDTNVVCEGYSKAFQYLYDLSVFDGDILCITIYGEVRFNLGRSYGHMWNLVRMEDGRSYLVDLTNIDAGYDLFMAVPHRGSPAEGYTFILRDFFARYRYEKRGCLDSFDEALLTLSEQPYERGSTRPPVVTVADDGASAQAESFEGLYARVALILDNSGQTGLYVTQVTINPDGTIRIPAFMVPGLVVKGINVALVPTLEDIQSSTPNAVISDFRML